MKNKMSLHHNGVKVRTSTMKPQRPWFKSDWLTLLRHTHTNIHSHCRILISTKKSEKGGLRSKKKKKKKNLKILLNEVYKKKTYNPQRLQG